MDFDRIIDRRGTRSVKWDSMGEFFGRDDLLPMWVADMDFRAPDAVVEALERLASFGVYGYAARGKGFFTAIQGWLAERHEWAVEESWICPCPGVVPAVNAAVRAMSQPGDGIVIQTPAYYPFFSAVTDNGRQVIDNPLRYDGEHYTIDFADLEPKLARARVLVLCNPHNPVARVWRRDELMTLAEMCLRQDVWVVSDDIHCDISFRPYTSIASYHAALAERTITLMSPSKAFGLAGLNTAYGVISNAALRSRFTSEIARTGYYHGTLFGDTALQVAYTECAPWLDALVKYLGRNLRMVEDAFRDHAGIRVVPVEGTFLAWLDFRGTGLEEGEVTRILFEEAKVALEKGSVFGAAGAGFQRLNMATPAPLLKQGLERILAAFAA